MKEFYVTENVLLKDFTDRVCAQASFVFRALLKRRDVRVNGVRVQTNLRLGAGDRVQYFLTAKEEGRTGFEKVYEDERVTVVDKESGVNSEAVYSALSEGDEVYFIHRLDRNTAGIMIFARTKGAEEALKNLFKTRRAEKVYLALVVGRPQKTHAVERARLEKDGERALVRISKSRGEEIETEYFLLEDREDCSLLKVILHTGKTHQIRAHLAYLGYPVLGDEKYGDRAANARHRATRQRLIAKELTLHCAEGELSYLNGKTFSSRKSL